MHLADSRAILRRTRRVAVIARTNGIEPARKIYGGRRALEILELKAATGAEFDFILLDMHMPEMDGTERARAIQSDTRTTAPMVLLTSAANQDRKELESVGIKAFLPKPLRQSALLETLTSLSGSPTAEAKGSGGPLAPHPAVIPRAPRGSNGRVLAAEDNEANQHVLIGIAEHLGYDLTVVSNGRAALDVLARDSSFRAVLMDCQMPELDGYQAARAIRELEGREQRARIPIIAVTAHALVGERQKVIAAGMDDYLTKPVSVEQLRRKLDHWFGLGPAPAGSSAPPLGRDLVDANVVEQLKKLASPKRPRFFPDLVEKFAEDSAQHRTAVLAAISANDPTAMRESSHSLKGSSRAIGAVEVARIAEKLEELAKLGTVRGAEALIEELDAAFEPSIAALRQAAAA